MPLTLVRLARHPLPAGRHLPSSTPRRRRRRRRPRAAWWLPGQLARLLAE